MFVDQERANAIAKCQLVLHIISILIIMIIFIVILCCSNNNGIKPLINKIWNGNNTTLNQEQRCNMQVQIVGRLTQDDANALIYMSAERGTRVKSTLYDKIESDEGAFKSTWNVNIEVEYEQEKDTELRQLLDDFNTGDLTLYYRK